MMYGFSSGWMLGIGLHALACLLLFFALASAVVWLARFANKAEVKKAFWSTLLIGVLAGLLSSAMLGSNMMGDWDEWDEDGEWDYEDMEDRREDMMDWDDEDEDEDEGESSDVEETETPAQ